MPGAVRGRAAGAVRAAPDRDAAGWKLFAISGQGQHFDGWWDMLTAQVAQGEWIAYAIRQLTTNAIVGTAGFLNIRRTRQCVCGGSASRGRGMCAAACRTR